MNHFRDQEEDFEQFKMLCRFMNPDAAAIVFDKKEVIKTESTQNIFEDMSKDLKGKYSPDELANILEDPEHYQNLDKIERAD